MERRALFDGLRGIIVIGMTARPVEKSGEYKGETFSLSPGHLKKTGDSGDPRCDWFAFQSAPKSESRGRHLIPLDRDQRIRVQQETVNISIAEEGKERRQ